MADYLVKKGFGKPTLIESQGGAFEIKLGDRLLFSKLLEHRFPEADEVVDLIRQVTP